MLLHIKSFTKTCYCCVEVVALRMTWWLK